MLPVPPPDPLPRTRERAATPRTATGPVLPPIAARRVGDAGVATTSAGEPAVAATLTALTDTAASEPSRAGTGDPRNPAAPSRAPLPPSISDAARALASLVDPDAQRAPIAASVRVDAPLLAQPPDAAQAQHLSALLARVVERSGLFYEAHQAQWIAGERKLDDLRSESNALSAAPSNADGRVAAQLALLDTGVLRLAFDAWPGQPVALEILDPRRPATAADPGAATWRLTLELATPALGKLRATFALQAGVLSIAIAADEARTRADVARALPALRRALASHDVALTGVVVADDHA